MKVGLATEGTYPLHGGGVSVWCDQLIAGMPEHDFLVMAVCATGDEPLLWELPANATGLQRIPLWGYAPPRRRTPQAARSEFARAHQGLVYALTRPDDPDSPEIFKVALRSLYRMRHVDLESLLLSNESLGRLLEAWRDAAVDRGGDTRRHGVEMTFADALAVAGTIAHFARPLSFTPPKVDVVHAVSNGLAGLIGLISKWAYGAPFVLTEHGVYLRERYLSHLYGDETYPVRSIMMAFYRLLSAVVYSSADVIRPGSKFNQRWELRTGADQSRLETIYNGVEVQRFNPSEAEPAQPTIAWLGRIDPLKDLHTLIRAFKLVVEQLPAAKLRLFGKAPQGNEGYRDSCVRLVSELGLTESVTFEGRVESLDEAYASGHVFVLSSVSEGLPYALLEAMASGRPVVATDVGGVSEAVSDCGLIVPARDVERMAFACLDLLTDDAKRRELGRRARERVRDHFTVQGSLDAYRKTYLEVSEQPLYLRRSADVPVRPTHVHQGEYSLRGLQRTA